MATKLTPEENARNQARRKELAEIRKKQENRRKFWMIFPWILFGLAVIGLLLWHPWLCNDCTIPAPIATATEAPAVTEVPTEPAATEPAPTEPAATEPVPTEVPVVDATEEPILATCTTSFTADGNIMAPEWTTPDKATLTNGFVLTGHSVPINGYVGAELKKIQSTWVTYDVIACPGQFGVAFGYSVKIDGNTYSPGAIILLPAHATVEILDGELVVWNDLSKMHDDIETRISTEIKNGNLSIHGPLAFSFLSKEFSAYVPSELITANKVTIVK